MKLHYVAEIKSTENHKSSLQFSLTITCNSPFLPSTRIISPLFPCLWVLDPRKTCCLKKPGVKVTGLRLVTAVSEWTSVMMKQKATSLSYIQKLDFWWSALLSSRVAIVREHASLRHKTNRGQMQSRLYDFLITHLTSLGVVRDIAVFELASFNRMSSPIGRCCSWVQTLS